MPAISIVIPCYNEETTIRPLLEAIYQQTYPRAEMEVILADGRSTDGTLAQIEQFTRERPDLPVRVLREIPRSIPVALNRAIAAASGEIILRLDAHSAPHPAYVERCAADLRQGLGDNVGGVWEIRPGGTGWAAQGIAAAVAHPLGVGDALYRYATQPQRVDTVPFGAFHRSLVDRLGGYDECLLTNEDYEFNTRIRQAGGVVWLNPAIRSVYYARASFAKLARQYARYGYWKAQMLRRYPKTLRWRQAIPPLFVISLLALAALGWINPWVWAILAAETALYGAALITIGAQIALQKRKLSLILSVPLAMAIMHLTWGASLLWGFLRPASVQPRK